MDPGNRIYGYVAPIIRRAVIDVLYRLLGKSYSNSSFDIDVSTVDTIPKGNSERIAAIDPVSASPHCFL